MTSGPPARISAAQVSTILRRAAEIDAGGDSLTPDELRRIAAEAGIDPAATETAIQEVMSGGEAVPAGADDASAPLEAAAAAHATPAKRQDASAPSRALVIAGGAVGTAMGFMTALPEALGIPAFGATVIYLVVRAMQSMRRGAQLDFQLQNFAVWFGMLVGGLAIGAFDDVEVVAFAFLFWIVCSVVGGMLVRFGPREEGPGDATATLPPAR